MQSLVNPAFDQTSLPGRASYSIKSNSLNLIHPVPGLVVGGTTDGSTGISDVELYDPETGLWRPTGGPFNGSLFNTTHFAQGAAVGGSGSPGGILSVSANGTNSGTGILWAVVNITSDANQSVVAGALHAYNAQNISSELWNSAMLARDSLGSLAKFVPPTVANGRVYVATFSGQLNVYGLLPSAANLNAATLENQPRRIPTAELLARASDKVTRTYPGQYE